MSHLELHVIVSTDGAEMAERRKTSGAHRLMAEVVRDEVATALLNGSNHRPLYDANGNKVGVLDLLEVID